MTGFLPTDNVTASYTRTAGESVAGSPYTINATLNPAGVLGNYNITYNTANFTITGIVVTPSITANNKVYDDTNTATFTCTLTGVVGTDDVNCSGGTATFINQNVGTNKLVTAISLTLSGADIASYTLASTTPTDTSDITARTLNVTATGTNKPYDGNTTATVVLAHDRLVGDVLALRYNVAISMTLTRHSRAFSSLHNLGIYQSTGMGIILAHGQPDHNDIYVILHYLPRANPHVSQLLNVAQFVESWHNNYWSHKVRL